MVVNEMRRDNANLTENENFAFALDTFYDRRNSVTFSSSRSPDGWTDRSPTREPTATGTRLGSGGAPQPDGWTAEAAVPFKSLRFQAGVAQIWGLQLRRVNRWKNEVSYLTRVPDGLGNNGLSRTSMFATLVGVEAPSGSRVRCQALRDDRCHAHRAATRGSDVFGGDVGSDMKYGVTRTSRPTSPTTPISRRSRRTSSRST